MKVGKQKACLYVMEVCCQLRDVYKSSVHGEYVCIGGQVQAQNGRDKALSLIHEGFFAL